MTPSDAKTNAGLYDLVSRSPLRLAAVSLHPAPWCQAAILQLRLTFSFSTLPYRRILYSKRSWTSLFRLSLQTPGIAHVAHQAWKDFEDKQPTRVTISLCFTHSFLTFISVSSPRSPYRRPDQLPSKADAVRSQQSTSMTKTRFSMRTLS